jgi:hypothetical protein
MKLHGLVQNFYIHVSGSDLYIPIICPIWNHYFSLLRERTLFAQLQEQREGKELLQSSGWRQFPALPSAPAVEPRVHINDQHKNFQFGKLGIINRSN